MNNIIRVFRKQFVLEFFFPSLCFILHLSFLSRLVFLDNLLLCVRVRQQFYWYLMATGSIKIIEIYQVFIFSNNAIDESVIPPLKLSNRGIKELYVLLTAWPIKNTSLQTIICKYRLNLTVSQKINTSKKICDQPWDVQAYGGTLDKMIFFCIFMDIILIQNTLQSYFAWFCKRRELWPFL